MNRHSNEAEPPGLDHGRASVNGISLHYVVSGPASAPPVILLHGFPQSWLAWRLILPRLARQYRVVAVDLRGYGDSDMPHGEEGYDKRTMAADIRALAGHLDIGRPLVIGHDRGARVVRRYALDYPDALAGAAMLDILPEEWVYDHLTAGDAAERYWHWVFQVVADLPETLIAGHEEEYLAFLLSRPAGLLDRMRADGSWEEYRRAFLRPGAVKAVLSDYRATFKVDVPRYREERKSGRRIAVPTFLLWGSRGNLAGQPVLDVWREVAEDVGGEEIPDCGHYLPEEQPGKVTEHLLRFAEKCL
jgi:pimeloyl-ACP methyl ester carboxylesterase